MRDQVFTRTFNGFSAVVSPRALAELERAHDVAGVFPVRTVYPAAPTAETVAGSEFQPTGGRGTQIILPGFSGSGVTVALLDSGVDRRHPYLRGKVERGFDVVDGDTNVVPAAKPGEPVSSRRTGRAWQGSSSVTTGRQDCRVSRPARVFCRSE